MKNETLKKQDFGNDFCWGVATSAFQIEGAHDVDGKGPSIWDVFCQQPGKIFDGSNGTVACDHYNRFDSDLDLIKQLGVNAYRLSISWPRVQPNGYGSWNESGFDFYAKLLDGLEARNIKAHVTLYHWDLPQKLQDHGGWENPQTCEYFAIYAEEIANRFGDRVETITTHNEPWVVSILGYQHGVFAPGIKDRKRAMQVAHHLLLSHGMAVLKIRATGCKVKLGIVLNQSPIYPASEHPEDVRKAKIDDGLIVRWYMDPLLKSHYPQDVLDFLGPDQPAVAAEDMKTIGQPIDFIGINYYTRNFSDHKNPWDAAKAGLEVTDMGWEIYPQGITELLCRLDHDYDLPDIYITENGAAFNDVLTEDGCVKDAQRVSYLHDHIEALKQAKEYGISVKGYFAWSLMDNFEWASGYEKRFGLLYVDYATQQRYFKDSAKWYKNFLMESL